MRQSEQINELAEALALAQAKMVNPVKNQKAETGKFGYQYIDLAAVIDAIREPLTANGLSFVQVPSVADNYLHIVTRLMHKSGQWIEGTYPACPLGLDPQRTGSAVTYAKRYSISALIGLAAEQDDDGATATKDWQPHRTPQQSQQRFERRTETGEPAELIATRLRKQIDTCQTSEELDIEVKAVGFKTDLNHLQKSAAESAAAVIEYGRQKRQSLVERQNAEMMDG
jgi:hypothetical protein